MLVRIRHRRVTTGLETYPGKQAVVSDDFIDGEGRVQMDGAFWTAKDELNQGLKQGDQVTVVNVKGLTLTVKPNDRPNE